MGYSTYLKIDGIDGDCTDEGQQGWMLLDSFNHSVSSPQPRGGAVLNDLSICKFADRTTPLLARATAEGRLYRSALIRMVRTDGSKEKLMELRLADVLITMHSLAGGPQGDLRSPYENFSLHFEKIEWVYQPSAAEGGKTSEVRTSWSADAVASVA